jgi:hypothetical protein
MSLVMEQHEFLKHVVMLLTFAYDKGYVVTSGEFYRTPEQQAIYVKLGRSQTMTSNHMRRCAADFNFFLNGKLIWDKSLLQALGDYWESLHPKNAWGGNWKSFKDVPHFERRP